MMNKGNNKIEYITDSKKNTWRFILSYQYIYEQN